MADQAIIKSLESKALLIRKKLLELRSQTGVHIGGNLSVTDAIHTLNPWIFRPFLARRLPVVLWQHRITIRSADSEHCALP